MKIRSLTQKELPACAQILMSVYNNELWQCDWSFETAQAYLRDYTDCAKFVGFVAAEDEKIVGAILCHEKIWWNNSELFVDEMFVLPELQRQGIGTKLLEAAEDVVRSKHLAGLTLSTNRFAPAPQFYRKNGFSDAAHILFMYKECP